MQPDAPNAAADPWWAICLCPDWCGACRDYRSSFDALARPPPPPTPPPARGWPFALRRAGAAPCRDYRSSFDALARAHPGVRFEWVDIEDEADIAGDLEFETFPTLL